MPSSERILAALKERAKELNCMYEVERVLNRIDRPMEEAFVNLVDVIGPGWQYPDICSASIRIGDQLFQSDGFAESEWKLESAIKVNGDPVGQMCVYYSEDRPLEDDGPFLNEELQLIKSLADRVGQFLLFHKLEMMGEQWKELGEDGAASAKQHWRVVVDLLRETDDALFVRISRKMLNYLCSIGISEGQEMLQRIDLDYDPEETGTGESNVPGKVCRTDQSLLLEGAPFELAAQFISGEGIIDNVQKWIQADKAAAFLQVLDNPRSTLGEIREALRRFQRAAPDGEGLPPSTMKSVRVALTQRILTEQLEFVQTAKDHVQASFFRGLMDKIVMPAESHGKLGGKASGLHLAHCILQNKGLPVAPDEPVELRLSDDDSEHEEMTRLIQEVRIPKTWHISSDAILEFIAYNDLEDVLHQKYKKTDAIRRDYPNIIRLFKNSSFPPSLVHGLSAALDDFDGVPLVIRSSSLLEDRAGTAFSGKYKSLFIANQGTKKEGLAAMLDAVAEIYASMFGPDPIEYRRERGVLEFDEQMGILIQEVVGKKIDKYFFPAFAGVAFSRNEFRWSPRISREDGLTRLVPGLGTRAVDRTGDDYPVLVVPGKPELRVNVAIDEIVRYSPNHVDVINLETNSFETVSVQELLKTCGSRYPALGKVFSVMKDGRLVKPVSLLMDPDKERLVASFDGLRSEGDFLPQIKGMMKVLEANLKTPVDVEFAHDGDHLYILQCRPQGQSDVAAPSPIPQDISEADIVFTANKFVSNGRIPDIRYIVYVDPDRYNELPGRKEMKAVGKTVGLLNKLLPKKQFLLMGPGRWGSRGDIKLGVSVSYADINNTSMLIEIARQKGSYVPDVSFGTHFFQDLVEAGIGYLPLYPDMDGVHFSENFLTRSNNILTDFLPEAEDLSEVVRVIDVMASSQGRIMKVLLNADLDEAMACLTEPGAVPDVIENRSDPQDAPQPTQFWRWRRQMAERMAMDLEYEKLGVKDVYLFGSVKNANAGPASDIDLLVHFIGDSRQKACLKRWFDGWSRCLAEINYLKTGYRADGLLDVHLITDKDIAVRSSFAVKIGAVTDAAFLLARE
jgi:pyruvate, water dikinase